MARDHNPQHDVVLVLADLSSGGAQRVATLVAKAWLDRGLRVAIVTLSDPSSDFHRLDPRIVRISLQAIAPSASPIQGLLANLARLRGLRRTLRVLGAPTVISFVAGMNILTILATAGWKGRVIISERNDPARQSLGEIWDWLRRRLYRHADLVTVNTRGGLATLRGFVPENKLRYLPNPLVLPAVAPPAAERTPVILAVGRLVPQKAFDILLEAFAQARPVLPGWQLAIAGEGPLSTALRIQADRLGIADDVRWLGRVGNLTDHYARSAIFALPSRFEGTPNALLEAMAGGLACVVSDASPGPMDLVAHDTTGLVVRTEDAGGLADALVLLARHADLRQRLGAAARLTIAPYAVDSVIDSWSQLLARPTSC